ncbi:MAG: hypothetical protein DWQ19_08795 [Crenarchaeota archaeon]|nr:MAG: hypothetical protein DWQ19_08795 [Thermoproteota archaeon]
MSKVILNSIKIKISGELEDQKRSDTDLAYTDPALEAAEEITEKLQEYAEQLCEEAGFEMETEGY